MKQSIQFWVSSAIALCGLVATSPTQAQIPFPPGTFAAVGSAIRRPPPDKDITIPILDLTFSKRWGFFNPIELLAPTCSAYAGPGSSNFIFTGHGGLPPTPREAVSSEQPMVDLGAPIQNQENRASAAIPTNPTSAESTPIVPATGWVFNTKGEVTLTALAPNATPHGFGSNRVPCGAAQK